MVDSNVSNIIDAFYILVDEELNVGFDQQELMIDYSNLEREIEKYVLAVKEKLNQ